MMLQVRVRSEEGESVPFCEIPMRREAIEGAMELVNSYGFNVLGTDDIAMASCSGEFVYTGESAYFEIFIPIGD